MVNYASGLPASYTMLTIFSFELFMEIILDQFTFFKAKILLGAMSNMKEALFEDSDLTRDFLLIVR